MQPLDLDLYVDCSGSMPNPQVNVSYLTLAGAIVALSALRAGARVGTIHLSNILGSMAGAFTVSFGFVAWFGTEITLKKRMERGRTPRSARYFMTVTRLPPVAFIGSASRSKAAPYCSMH